MKREKEVIERRVIWSGWVLSFWEKIYLDIEVKKGLILPNMNMMMTLLHDII